MYRQCNSLFEILRFKNLCTYMAFSYIRLFDRFKGGLEMKEKLNFVKYNEKLIKNKDKLNEKERYIIFLASNSISLKCLLEEDRKVLNNLKKRYDKLIEDYVNIEIEGNNEDIKEEIIDLIEEKLGYYEYVRYNPFWPIRR